MKALIATLLLCTLATVGCVGGSSLQRYAGEYKVDPRRTKWEAHGVKLSEEDKQYYRLTLNEDGTFVLYPFHLKGPWRVEGNAILIRPGISYPSFEYMMTGDAKQKDPPSELVYRILDSNTLAFEPQVQIEDGEFYVVVVRQN